MFVCVTADLINRAEGLLLAKSLLKCIDGLDAFDLQNDDGISEPFLAAVNFTVHCKISKH